MSPRRLKRVELPKETECASPTKKARSTKTALTATQARRTVRKLQKFYQEAFNTRQMLTGSEDPASLITLTDSSRFDPRFSMQFAELEHQKNVDQLTEAQRKKEVSNNLANANLRLKLLNDPRNRDNWPWAFDHYYVLGAISSARLLELGFYEDEDSE